jgi:hypothetical protein
VSELVSAGGREEGRVGRRREGEYDVKRVHICLVQCWLSGHNSCACIHMHLYEYTYTHRTQLSSTHPDVRHSLAV